MAEKRLACEKHEPFLRLFGNIVVLLQPYSENQKEIIHQS